MRRKFAISQSALALYRKCPYAYKLKYLNKCKQIFYDPSILDVGSYVHDAIDKYYKLHFLMDAEVNDILVETYEELQKLWDPSLLPTQLKKAYTCLEHHAQWEHQNLSRGIRTKPFTEQRLKHNNYYGIIDYIDLPHKQVIDWKTGAKAYLSKDYRMQAHIYRVLFEEEFNMKLDYFLFFFLHPNQWRKVKYDDEKQIKVAKETDALQQSLIESLESGNFDKCPKTENACKYCELAYYCQVKGV